MAKLHVIYIPGLGDDKVAGQAWAVSTWRWYGVESELFQMKWSDDIPWENKFSRLLARIDELHASGKKVGLVGASAGGGAVINAFAARKNVISGVVVVAGKVNRPETIGTRYHDKNPSFIDSAYTAPESLKELTSKDRRRVMSIFSIKDGLLATADSKIPGAHNRYTLIMGHPIVIALQITLGAVGFIHFLKTRAKS